MKVIRTSNQLILIVLCLGLSGFLIQCGASPDTQAVNAIHTVLKSAYEKNPEGIQQQLDEDPANAYEVMYNIVDRHPDVQVTLAEHDLFAEQDRLFAEAWTRFISDKLSSDADDGIHPIIKDATPSASD